MADFRLPQKVRAGLALLKLICRAGSSLSVAREVAIDAFRQQTFASTLATPRECSASTLCPHPRPKTVLALARSLGWLKSAFHRAEK